MNILIDTLDSILKSRIGDVEFYTNFRNGILFEQLMNDPNVKKEDKPLKAILLFYANPKEVLKNKESIEKAIDDIIWFYSCGKIEHFSDKESKKKTKNKTKNKTSNIYDFNYDDGYIYSAFMQQYGIDLQEIDYLHWWKFKSLFNSLNSDTKIVEIMGYRSLDLGTIKDKKEKTRLKKLKDIYRLPDMRTEEEKEKDFGSSLW